MDSNCKNCYFSVHKGCNYIRNNWIKNSIPHVHPHKKRRRKSSKFQKYPIKDVGGASGHKMCNGHTDG